MKASTILLTCAMLALTACGEEPLDSGESMAQYKPDAWDIVDPVNTIWGTDFDEDASITNTVGSSALKLISGTPAADPELQSSGWIPIVEGMPYIFTAIAQADSVAAGNTVEFIGDWYDVDRAIVSSSTVHNAVLSGAGSWLELSGIFDAPSTSRFLKLRIGKNNTAFNAYFDYAGVKRFPRTAWSYRATDFTLAGTDAWVKVPMLLEIYDHGSINDAVTNFRTDIPSTGIWSMSADIYLESLPDGDHVEIAIGQNGNPYLFGARFAVGATDDARAVVSVSNALLTAGDYVEVFARQNSGGDLTISAANFQIAELL